MVTNSTMGGREAWRNGVSDNHHHYGQDGAASASAGPTAEGQRVRDPVCGMQVDPQTAQSSHRLGETTYYFCSARCLDKFKADPDRYLDLTYREAAIRG